MLSEAHRRVPDTLQALDKYLLDELIQAISSSFYPWSAYSVPRPMPDSGSCCDEDAALVPGYEVTIKEWDEGKLTPSETLSHFICTEPCETDLVLVIQMREQGGKAPAPKSSPS